MVNGIAANWTEGFGATAIKFGFFKKDNNGDKKRDDLFDPAHDSLDFDALEESGRCETARRDDGVLVHRSVS